jgi:hypothetical protein
MKLYQSNCHHQINAVVGTYSCIAELKTEIVPAEAQHFLDNSVLLYFLVTVFLSCKMTDNAIVPDRNESIC